jgi:hypothetical protein
MKLSAQRTAFKLRDVSKRKVIFRLDFLSLSASLGAVEPGLEHEDVPEVEVPVAGAGLVFLPFLAAGGGV